MLKRMIGLLRGELEPVSSEHGPFERRMIAVAALLLEAMYVDHRIDEVQRASVRAQFRRHFKLDEAQIDQLLELAEQRYAESLDDWEFAEAVRVGFSLTERREILTMAWEVVYADGELAELEARMMDRLAEHLELGADDVESARATSIARSGLASRSASEE